LAEQSSYASVEALGSDLSLRMHHKAEILQESFPAAFNEVVEFFRDAFPSIETLKVNTFRPSAFPSNVYGITISATETGVVGPIDFGQMSLGMQRYLSFLIHLSFAPPGTVVLIDELESSFGVNCLPAVTDFLLRRAPDLQFIITSHHPYIIEKIPPSHWKIVTRHGSRVRVLDAKSIPALVGGRSHLDRFTRLINLPEYEQGIQGTGS
jgi:predicted ATPase